MLYPKPQNVFIVIYSNDIEFLNRYSYYYEVVKSN